MNLRAPFDFSDLRIDPSAEYIRLRTAYIDACKELGRSGDTTTAGKTYAAFKAWERSHTTTERNAAERAYWDKQYG